MLRSTFQHLKGMGKKAERNLWKKGITTWKAYEERTPMLWSSSNGDSNNALLSDSINAYQNGDMTYFAETLPTAEYYRVALEFPKNVIFLDIETTGLSLYYDIISIVGWSIGKEFGVYINGQDDSRLREALARAKVIVTFNGTMFDLKFLNKHFKEELPIPPVHLDLRFFAKRVDLTGGQKAIEKQIGFERESDVQGMLGEAAPILWHKYRRGEKGAMERLIEYNHADIEGMKWILDTCIREYLEKDEVPKKIQKQPKFAQQISTINWSTRKPKKTDTGKIYIPKFKGSNKPLITYDQLNAIHNLDDFCAVGIDLVSSETRETGFSVLRGRKATTCRVKTDDEMIRLAIEAGANIVSIDSPLSIPKGRTSFFDDDPNRKYGIVRECEKILARRGVKSYPCLIRSMQKLTQRGMLLAEKFRKLGIPVIESYPGAAQDIMSIPRKQAGLDYLVEGLKEFGLTGDFINTPVSHDELDAITSAVVGHFFWVGMYEGLGTPDEEYLIIPDLHADYKKWLSRKVYGISGQIAAGKTTIARHIESNGYAYTRYSQALKDMLGKDISEATRSELQNLGWKIHQEKGQRWLGKLVIEKVENKHHIVIDGLRFLEDHALMIEAFGPAFQHIHVKASLANREKRISSRPFEDVKLPESAKRKVEHEIPKLEKVAHQVITNNGTQVNMLKKVDQLLIS